MFIVEVVLENVLPLVPILFLKLVLICGNLLLCKQTFNILEFEALHFAYTKTDIE